MTPESESKQHIEEAIKEFVDQGKVPNPKRVRCLRCGRGFKSWNPRYNRVCARCHRVIDKQQLDRGDSPYRSVKKKDGSYSDNWQSLVDIGLVVEANQDAPREVRGEVKKIFE